MWRQLRRGCVNVVRCTVERLMRRLGFAAWCEANALPRPSATPPRKGHLI
ncbi:hypothetical protein [Vreelandella sp. V005]